MLLVLSPAKSLDYETQATLADHTLPQFVQQSAELIELLKPKSPAQIAELMDLSDALATLNVARYGAWSKKFSRHNSKQAVLAFNGDVYEGLDAKTLSAKDLAWAQDHVAILSGLYGVLRPLDWMQPYRLEMGTKLPNARGKDLYAFWGDSLAAYINEQLAGDPHPLLLNLASHEYFKAVNRKALKVPVVECVFEDWKAGAWKIISFHAKRARGLMARHVIKHQIKSAKGLQRFDSEGYGYDAAASSPERLVFRRRGN
ncbi:hypothetical protein GALL_505510 [mine drainage metagenome]|uniref:Uncharacterized protein n=1 Tax=mine drainage metagenome TaxID=410659 RepID=A0A1J5PJY2_9ZZZZ